MSHSSLPDNLSTRSDFTVHTGPAHLHSPLGHAELDAPHYIAPSPGYTTEYEDAFQDRTLLAHDLPRPDTVFPISTEVPSEFTWCEPRWLMCERWVLTDNIIHTRYVIIHSVSQGGLQHTSPNVNKTFLYMMTCNRLCEFCTDVSAV